jgi:hypothetical protein
VWRWLLDLLATKNTKKAKVEREWQIRRAIPQDAEWGTLEACDPREEGVADKKSHSAGCVMGHAGSVRSCEKNAGMG